MDWGDFCHCTEYQCRGQRNVLCGLLPSLVESQPPAAAPPVDQHPLRMAEEALVIGIKGATATAMGKKKKEKFASHKKAKMPAA